MAETERYINPDIVVPDITTSTPVSRPMTIEEHPSIVSPVDTNLSWGQLKPVIDGLQAGSWAIVLVILVTLFSFRKKFEGLFDSFIGAINQLKQSQTDSINYQKRATLYLKKIRDTEAAELVAIINLENRVRELTTSVEALTELVKEKQ